MAVGLVSRLPDAEMTLTYRNNKPDDWKNGEAGELPCPHCGQEISGGVDLPTHIRTDCEVRRDE